MAKSSQSKAAPTKNRPGRFDGKVVLVTGASNGIGLETARLFAARGATVVSMDRAGGEQGAAPEFETFHADISKEKDVVTAVRRILARHKQIDVLVNNAGIGATWPAVETALKDWTRILDVNLTGQFLVAREVAKSMIKRKTGRIVMLSSQAAIIALHGHAAYAASKSGLLGLMRVMALELAPHNITVNAVSPTIVATQMAVIHWGGAKGRKAKADIPMGRFVEPIEVAEAIAFLSSDGAAMITGVNLPIDGGYTSK